MVRGCWKRRPRTTQMASYPSTLPLPTYAGYTVTPTDATMRSDMDKGSARTRRITSVRNDNVDVTFDFTDAQFHTFRQWWDDASTGIAGGSIWFTMNVALGNTSITNETVRPVGGYKATLSQGMYWNVTLKLEVR